MPLLVDVLIVMALFGVLYFCRLLGMRIQAAHNRRLQRLLEQPTTRSTSRCPFCQGLGGWHAQGCGLLDRLDTPRSRSAR